jgi:hypothetical protein
MRLDKQKKVISGIVAYDNRGSSSKDVHRHLVMLKRGETEAFLFQAGNTHRCLH